MSSKYSSPIKGALKINFNRRANKNNRRLITYSESLVSLLLGPYASSSECITVRIIFSKQEIKSIVDSKDSNARTTMDNFINLGSYPMELSYLEKANLMHQMSIVRIRISTGMNAYSAAITS